MNQEPRLNSEERKKLIALSIELPDLRTQRSRRSVLWLAGLEWLESEIDLSDPPREAIADIIRYLSAYGRLEDGRSALGCFLDIVKERVGIQQTKFIDMLLEKYSMMAPIEENHENGNAIAFSDRLRCCSYPRCCIGASRS